jgi:ORF6N domain-containing protein
MKESIDLRFGHPRHPEFPPTRSGGMGDEAKRRDADEALEPLILSARNQRVMLDADLARLYGVATMRFNEAFKRNQRRFPADFAFQLTAAEHVNLRSQIAMSSSQSIDSAGESTHGGRRHLPWAFTEHGALMAASVLRSERAVQMSVYVIRAFVRLRERVAANASVLKRLAEIDGTLLQQDAALRDIYRKLLPLLQPPPDPPRRRIGFHSDGA